MIKTRLSVRQIQLYLRNSFLFNQRNDIIVPNVSWGLLPYEADLLAIKPSGRVTEIEIKRSLADLKADFRKHHQHDYNSVYRFYYCVPEALVEKAKKAILEYRQSGAVVPITEKDCPALLCYTETGEIKDTGFGTADVSGYGKMPANEKETITAGRLASLRYWNLLEETVHPEDHGAQKRIRELSTEVKALKATLALCEGDYSLLKRFLRKRYSEVWNEYLELSDEHEHD